MMSLSKLWLFLLTLISGLMLLTFLLSPAQVRRSLDQSVTSKMELAQQSASLLLQNSARMWIDTATQLGSDPVLQSSLEELGRGQSELPLLHRTARDHLKKINETLKVSLIVLTDARGRVLARVGQDETVYTDAIDGFPLVGDAVRGYRLDDLWFWQGALYRMAAAPVVSSGRDRYVGAVILGQAVTADLAEQLHSAIGVDVAFLCGGKVLASSRSSRKVPDDHLAQLAADHAEDLQNSGHTAPLALNEDGELLMLAGIPGEAAAQGAALALLTPGTQGASLSSLLTSLIDAVAKSELPFDQLPFLGIAIVLSFLIGLLLLRTEAEVPFERILGEVRNVGRKRADKVDEKHFSRHWRELALAINNVVRSARAEMPKETSDELRAPPSQPVAPPPREVPASPVVQPLPVLTPVVQPLPVVPGPLDRPAPPQVESGLASLGQPTPPVLPTVPAQTPLPAPAHVPAPMNVLPPPPSAPIPPPVMQQQEATPLGKVPPPRPTQSNLPMPLSFPPPLAEQSTLRPAPPPAGTSRISPSSGSTLPARLQDFPSSASSQRVATLSDESFTELQDQPEEGTASSKTFHDPSLEASFRAADPGETAPEMPTVRDIPSSLVQAAIESALQSPPASFKGAPVRPPIPGRKSPTTGPISSAPPPPLRAPQVVKPPPPRPVSAPAPPPSRPVAATSAPSAPRVSPPSAPGGRPGAGGRGSFDEATAVAEADPKLLQATVESDEELDAAFRQTYQEFVVTKQRCNEPVEGLTFDKFVVKLRQSREQIMRQHSCKSVRFHVYVKDGKAALKATPVAR